MAYNYSSYLTNSFPCYTGSNYYNRNNKCYNPCQTQCYNPCQTQCQTPCYNPCPPACPPPCPPICPTVTYVASPATVTTVPSGGTPIPIGATTITGVTPITGFTGTPTTNIGGITVNPATGQFTIPIAGRYLLSAFVAFAPNSFGGTRDVYIYKIDGSTGVITLLAANTTPGNTSITSYNTVTTFDNLQVGDRIFFAATQNSGAPVTVTTESRFGITRLC